MALTSRSTIRLATIVATAGVLSACGTQPMRPAAESAPSAEAPPAKPPAAQSKGGGYYLDDGPGDSPPDNLGALPDAEPRPEPLHPFANRPYSVFGQAYVPQKQVSAYRRRGVASWYGRKFHGQKTSTGETYNMYAMTAAHPTLPLPSYARVTNVATGKSVVVRVNDRGPFIADRLIDLSYAAAYKLDYLQKGSTLVEVESIVPGAALLAAAPERVASAPQRPPEASADKPATPVAPAPAAVAAPTVVAMDETDRDDTVVGRPHPGAGVDEGIFVQLAAFSNNDNAERFRAQVLRQLGWLSDRVFVSPKGGTYRLQVGPYRDISEAGRIAERISDALRLRPFIVGN